MDNSMHDSVCFQHFTFSPRFSLAHVCLSTCTYMSVCKPIYDVCVYIYIHTHKYIRTHTNDAQPHDSSFREVHDCFPDF